MKKEELMDYNRIHASRALRLMRWFPMLPRRAVRLTLRCPMLPRRFPLRGKRVLIVGCNTGDDCKYFTDCGAQVDGIDVIPEVGKSFQHRNVRYFQASAECMPLPVGAYDLVYCFATMEHIPNIEAAFSEMARVTAPGGFIYCVASPLWHSKFGHHKPDMIPPWGHLLYTRDELAKICGKPEHVDYVLDRRYFNQTPAARYIEVCESLGMEIIVNRLDMENASALEGVPINGYDKKELLAVTHTFIGEKRATAVSLPVGHGIFKFLRKLPKFSNSSHC